MMRENAFQANIAKSIIDSQIQDHGLNLEQFMLWHEVREKSNEELMDNVKSSLDALC